MKIEQFEKLVANLHDKTKHVNLHDKIEYEMQNRD